MTVAELIEELSLRPAGARVVIVGTDGCSQEATTVSQPYSENPFRQGSQYRVDIT